jgi:hypothetical protein
MTTTLNGDGDGMSVCLADWVEGWDTPPPRGWNGAGPATEGGGKRKNRKLRTLDTWYDTPIIDPLYVVEDLIPTYGLVVGFGEPGAGKSSEIRRLISPLIRGVGSRYGRRILIPGRVIYLALEDKEVEARRRLIANGLTPEDSKDLILICEDTDEEHFCDYELFIKDPILWTSNLVAEFPPTNVFIDVATNFMPNLESFNDNALVASKLLLPLRRIGRRQLTTIWCMHHTNRDGDYLGAGAWKQVPDTMLMFRGKDSKYREILAQYGGKGKVRYGRPLPPYRIYLNEDDVQAQPAKPAGREAASEYERLVGQILELVEKAPGVTQAMMEQHTSLHRKVLGPAIKDLVNRKLLKTTDLGVAHHPFKYYLAWQKTAEELLQEVMEEGNA